MKGHFGFRKVVLFSLTVIFMSLCATVYHRLSPVLTKGVHYRRFSSSSSSPRPPLTPFPDNLSIPCNWTSQILSSLHPLKQSPLQSYHGCPSHHPNHRNLSTPRRSNPIVHVPNVTSCLHRVIQDNCDVSGVPPVVHYVRFGRYNLNLDGFLSLVSVARWMKPCVVVFHGDVVPEGVYWHALVGMMPRVVHVHMERPRRIFGHKILRVEHSSDVARLRILIEYGGVYLDSDMLVLKPLQDLYKHSVVVSTEIPGIKICNAIILSQPNSTFLRIWLDSYTTFNNAQWIQHSGVIPFQLSRRFPHLVRVVNSFFRYGPHPSDLADFYKANRTVVKMDWHQDHGVHIYTNAMQGLFYKKLRIDRQNNTMGDIVRHVLYGNEQACM